MTLFTLYIGAMEVEETVVSADKASAGSIGSGEGPSVNGERSASEKKSEGNLDNVVQQDFRASKGSRRTTSLLNLFIPLSQGMLEA